jgi:hypothetical protein
MSRQYPDHPELLKLIFYTYFMVFLRHPAYDMPLNHPAVYLILGAIKMDQRSDLLHLKHIPPVIYQPAGDRLTVKESG